MNFKTPARRIAALGMAATAAFAGIGVTAIATAPAAFAATTAVAVTTSAETASAVTAVADGLYRTNYNGNIYKVINGVATKLTLNQFIAMGQPAFKAAPVEFVKYTWAPGIYGVVKWGANANNWTVDLLTFAQWRSAGFPAPAAARLVPGTDLFKFSNSDQVFAKAPDGAQHVMTWNEYAAAGVPAVRTIANQGYRKLSWSNEVGYFTDLANGKGFRISLAQWLKDGAPRAESVGRLPGDKFSKFSNSAVVKYTGPLVTRDITFREWIAAGAPAPIVTQVAVAATAPVVTSGDPRSIARSMLASFGWSDSQFGCLDKLWMKESGWNYRAYNASSGATGIPQALPGYKMATAGADWRTNPATQIRWGLTYIKGRYGSPCSAWSHSVAVNWY